MGYQPGVGRREEDKQGGLEVHVRELLSEQWSRGVHMSLCLSDLPPRRLWLESGQPECPRAFSNLVVSPHLSQQQTHKAEAICPQTWHVPWAKSLAQAVWSGLPERDRS